ncbi:MAG TPA: T9SS type A sorting domain-containing protein, partial [Phnomibacter sp.]|nr:T9SS type A sorting domain-containing protein [Phnomibacter sp.]
GGLQYSYLHRGLGPGLHYYRLAMVEKDGTITRSQVVVLRIEAPVTVIKGLQRNPISSEAIINIYSAREQTVGARILDMAGRVITSRQGRLLRGDNQWRLSTSMLAQGIYNLHILTADGATSVLRVVKD